jgi:Uma2 family endonuclease
MATVASESKNYPTSDGRPMAETDLHRDLMVALIHRLQAWYATDPTVYVSGNLLLFYVRGNKRKHLSPDVFVVKGVGKKQRENYLVWEEGKGPDFVVEVTSSSTRKEDIKKKLELYRDVLKVPEYFLFDPKGDYLKPPLQGYRLVNGAYERIVAEQGRFRSEELGIYLWRDEADLKLYDPETNQWLLAPEEKVVQETLARQQAEQARLKAEQARLEAEQARLEAEQARLQAEQARLQESVARKQAEETCQRAEAEVERLRREIEALSREKDTKTNQ